MTSAVDTRRRSSGRLVTPKLRSSASGLVAPKLRSSASGLVAPKLRSSASGLVAPKLRSSVSGPVTPELRSSVSGPVTPELRSSEGGFTMIELLVSMAVILIVSGIVVGSTMDMTRLGQKMTNRSDMHSGVRNATALLQQEVGQAGRVSLPGTITLTNATGIGTFSPNIQSIIDGVVGTSTEGLFVGEHVIVGSGATEETVTLTAVGANSITANFAFAHAAGAQVQATGGFSAGVIPTTMMNGSTGNVMKIVGDVNGDGRMVYVEYTCDLANGRLYRNVMPITAAVKPAVTVEQILLTNLMQNPPNGAGVVPPCFLYQERTFSGTTWVIGVAIMTTVRSQQRDQNTGDFQRVTKALLNVSPRNVVNVWMNASLNNTNRMQPLPASVVQLLP